MQLFRTVFALLCLPFAVQASSLPQPDVEFLEPDMTSVELGWLLFYDPILSGNKTVSCATCHHPKFATSDGVSLGFGDGGTGLGPDRREDPMNPPEQRIPRNAPALFNLGAKEFQVFFHDGRLEADAGRPSGIRTPLGAEMEQGFHSALSAQAMFPVLSADEMAGHYSENDVAQAVRQGFLTGDGGAWDILSKRIEDIPEYRSRFDKVLGPDQPVTFADIANAIADFMVFEWRADDSAFDRHLRGESTLPDPALSGMQLFYGKANCASCHSGLFQTDHGFHSIALPQIGPGKAARFERHNRDVGRMRVTGRTEDAYRFRTPSLRNVTETAPYGHNGAYSNLESMVRHHLEPVEMLRAYVRENATLPGEAYESDFAVMMDAEEVEAIAKSNDLEPVPLTDQEIADVIAFLGALMDPVGLVGRLGIPETVPSGLPVDQ